MEKTQRNLTILVGESDRVKALFHKLDKLEPGTVNIITAKGSSSPKVNERTWDEINNDTNIGEEERSVELAKLPQRAFVRSLGAGDEFVVVDNTEKEIVPLELYDSNRKLFDYHTEIINVTTLNKGIEIPQVKKKFKFF